MSTSDTLVSIRCADDSRAIQLDPIGSAVYFDEVVVVDTPLPWPKPVFEHAHLVAVPGLVELAAQRGRDLRVLAAVPDAEAASDHRRVVRHHRAAGEWITGFERSEYVVPEAELPAMMRSLIADGEPTAAWKVASDVEHDLLLCTQGSHDTCCGRYGMRLHEKIAARWPRVRVTRVSHTGGHRYAPTGISLPDGRYWGYLDADLCDAIIEHSMPVDALAGSLRGSSALSSGYAQAAERAVFASVGWDWDGRHRRVSIEAEGPDRATVSVRSTAPDGTDPTHHIVDVEVTRVVPVITCGALGGVPHTKEDREYAVTGLRTAD